MNNKGWLAFAFLAVLAAAGFFYQQNEIRLLKEDIVQVQVQARKDAVREALSKLLHAETYVTYNKEGLGSTCEQLLKQFPSTLGAYFHMVYAPGGGIYYWYPSWVRTTSNRVDMYTGGPGPGEVCREDGGHPNIDPQDVGWPPSVDEQFGMNDVDGQYYWDDDGDFHLRYLDTHPLPKRPFGKVACKTPH